MRAFKAYPTLLRAYWARALEYRGQSIIWILSSVLPLIMMTVWLSIAGETGEVGSYDRVGFISYYLAVTLLRRLVGVWIIWDIDRDIRQGLLSPQLLRPIDPVHMHFSRILALRPLQLLLVGPPVVVAALLFGAQYDLRPFSLLLVLVAIFGAMCIEFFVQMAVGALGFWITQAVAVAEIWFYARALLSGWIIPIDLFPEAIVNWLRYLPFRYVLSFPIEMLLGLLSLPEIGVGLLLQYGWLAAIFGLYWLLWQRGLRQYGAVGA